MGGTSTISGGKLCLRIDPRVPTLSGCAASRGPTIKANTVPLPVTPHIRFPHIRRFRADRDCRGQPVNSFVRNNRYP
jgi:hypothetical protein